MKKVFNRIGIFVKKNILGFILGAAFVAGITLVNADYRFTATKVYYDKNTSLSTKTNVGAALDELYTRSAYGNATAAQILSGKTAYVGGNQVTGTMPNYGDKTITPANDKTGNTATYNGYVGKVTVDLKNLYTKAQYDGNYTSGYNAAQGGLVFYSYFTIGTSNNTYDEVYDGNVYKTNENDLRRGDFVKGPYYDQCITDSPYHLTIKKAGKYMIITTASRHYNGSSSTAGYVSGCLRRGLNSCDGYTFDVSPDMGAYATENGSQSKNYNNVSVVTHTITNINERRIWVEADRSNTNAMPTGSIAVIYLGA